MRIPDRTTSKLYEDSPAISGVKRFAVNGKEVTPDHPQGLCRRDARMEARRPVEFELPMEPQRVRQMRASSRTSISSRLNMVRWSTTSRQQTIGNIERKIGNAPLRTEWRPDLLGGVMVISGSWSDGWNCRVPNYARMNRVGRPHAYPGEKVDTMTGSAAGSSNRSKVWI